jgi:hypothetical protein
MITKQTHNCITYVPRYCTTLLIDNGNSDIIHARLASEDGVMAADFLGLKLEVGSMQGHMAREEEAISF